ISSSHFVCSDSRLSRYRHLRFFFVYVTAPTEICTLSLHDALPICRAGGGLDRVELRMLTERVRAVGRLVGLEVHAKEIATATRRSEEHTSELQSRENLVCRLLLEKKKKNTQKESRRHLI